MPASIESSPTRAPSAAGDPLRPRAAGGGLEGTAHVGEEDVEDRLVGLEEAALLVAEHLLEGLLGDARHLDHVPDRRRFVAFCRRDAQHRLQKTLPFGAHQVGARQALRTALCFFRAWSRGRIHGFRVGQCSQAVQRLRSPAPSSGLDVQAPDGDTYTASMKIGIVGLGYVGLPLAVAFAEAGHEVIGLDTDPRKVEGLNAGRSHIEDVGDAALAPLAGRLRATGNQADLASCEAIVICVPTPLTGSREPDLTYLLDSATALSGVLQPEQLVVLESTTYPGTTRERLQPILEESGLSAGRDFHLAFSPERIDPGRTDYTVRTTPKLVGGITPACAERARELYALICDEVIVLSSPEAAELSKLLENIFRSVNIALVNELAQLCDRLEIDVWEVVDAAATKPFGFMRFEPGPGMGGHCLPVDPFYLAFKAREHDFYPSSSSSPARSTRPSRPSASSGSSAPSTTPASRSRARAILLLGVSYKAGVGDTRESPALKIARRLREFGGEVSYHDPHVAELRRAGPGLGRPGRGARVRPTPSRSSPRTPSSTTPRSSQRPSWWSTSAASPAASRRPIWSGSSGLHLVAGDLGSEVGQHREVHEVGQELAEAAAIPGREFGVDHGVHPGDDPLGGDRRRRLGGG